MRMCSQEQEDAQYEMTMDEMRAMHRPGCGPIPKQVDFEPTPLQRALIVLGGRRKVASCLAYLRGTPHEYEWQEAWDKFQEQLTIVRKE